ncbi:MAG: hypothetical protein ACK4QL_04895 [Pseudanabaenaceae cyanobacterium]
MENCNPPAGKYIPSLEYIIDQEGNFSKANELRFQFLDYLHAQ